MPTQVIRGRRPDPRGRRDARAFARQHAARAEPLALPNVATVLGRCEPAVLSAIRVASQLRPGTQERYAAMSGALATMYDALATAARALRARAAVASHVADWREDVADVSHVTGMAAGLVELLCEVAGGRAHD